MKRLAGLPAFVCGMCMTAASTLCAAQIPYVADLGTLNTNGYSMAVAVNVGGEATGLAGTTNSATSEVFLTAKER